LLAGASALVCTYRWLCFGSQHSTSGKGPIRSLGVGLYPADSALACPPLSCGETSVSSSSPPSGLDRIRVSASGPCGASALVRFLAPILPIGLSGVCSTPMTVGPSGKAATTAPDRSLSVPLLGGMTILSNLDFMSNKKTRCYDLFFRNTRWDQRLSDQRVLGHGLLHCTLARGGMRDDRGRGAHPCA